MSFASSTSSLNTSLAWSLGNRGKGRVPLEFPFDLENGWYNEQPCTQFQRLEHRKEPKGFQHEFIVLKLTDGSICRVERMGDPNARFDALSSRGSLAHDFAECFRPDELTKASLAVSEVVAEVEFPCNLDIADVLMICRAIHEGEKTRNYTLQSFNCYFFSLAIQCCLTRLVAGWEDMIPRETWLSELKRSIDSSMSGYRPQRNEQSLLLRAYLILNPDDSWSMDDLLQVVQSMVHERTDLEGVLDSALNNQLWYQDLSAEMSHFAEGVVKKAWLQALRARIRPEQAQPTYPHVHALAKRSLRLRRRCMTVLMELVDSADDDTKHFSRKRILRSMTQAPEHSLLGATPLYTSMPLKLDYRGNKPPRLVETLTMAQWIFICWAHIQFMLQWLLCLAFASLGIMPLELGSKPRPCTIVDRELMTMISKLEQSGRIGLKGLTDFLQELRALRDSHPTIWNELPWTQLCRAVEQSLASEPHMHQEMITLQVRLKEQNQAKGMTVSHFQRHILTRIESQA